MNADLLERRQELVKVLARGFSLADAVTTLAEKYETTTRALYRDYESRASWMPILLGLKDKEAFLLEILSNQKELYRLAAREFLSADNSSARIGALRLMKDLNLDFFELVACRDVDERLSTLEEKTKNEQI